LELTSLGSFTFILYPAFVSSMTSEDHIIENSFSETLSQINEYLGSLEQLPDKSAFKSAVEDDLWRSITRQSDPPSEVQYDELPEVAHSLFGGVEENREESDPWWLEKFNWTAEFGGENTYTPE